MGQGSCAACWMYQVLHVKAYRKPKTPSRTYATSNSDQNMQLLNMYFCVCTSHVKLGAWGITLDRALCPAPACCGSFLVISKWHKMKQCTVCHLHMHTCLMHGPRQVVLDDWQHVVQAKTEDQLLEAIAKANENTDKWAINIICHLASLPFVCAQCVLLLHIRTQCVHGLQCTLLSILV